MTTMYLTQQTIYSTRCMRTCRAHAAPTAHSNKSCAHAASKSCIYIRMDAHLELESSSEQVQMEMGAVLMGRSESYPANIVDSSILLTRPYCRLVNIVDSLPLRALELWSQLWPAAASELGVRSSRGGPTQRGRRAPLPCLRRPR